MYKMVLSGLIFIGRAGDLTLCVGACKADDDENDVKRARVMNLMGISDPVTIVPSKPVIKPRPLRVRRFSKLWEFITSIIQALIREKFASVLTGSVCSETF